MGKCLLLLGCGSVNAFLHDAAAVFMACDLYTLVDHGIIQELVSRLGPTLEDFLNYMVSVDVFAHFFDPILKIPLYQHKMLINSANLNQLLYRPCAMSILTKQHRLRAHLLDDLG